MVKHLFIAGHGPKPNGGFDPGAYGFMSMGEHNYYKDIFFKHMKKYVGDRADVAFYTDKNVYAYQNMKAVVDMYGGVKNVIVHEMHFDALAGTTASGGHVIIHRDFNPDNFDLKIRDVINKFIGVRYTHNGHAGISGRNDLYNVNVARQLGLNYRLVELGFGTNRTDANTMLNRVDDIVKEYIEHVLGIDLKNKKGSKESKKQTPEKNNFILEKYSNQELADLVLTGALGNGQERKIALGNRYGAVQSIVNNKVKGTETKDIETLVNEVLAGKHGNGEQRKRSLGKNYDEVQKRINKKYNVHDVIEQVARDVIRGKYGNNPERRNRLIALGYNYNAVQKKVNELL